MTLSNDYLIAFLRGMPPILARRIKFYQDAAFRPVAAIRVGRVVGWGLAAAAAALAARALTGG